MRLALLLNQTSLVCQRQNVVVTRLLNPRFSKFGVAAPLRRLDAFPVRPLRTPQRSICGGEMSTDCPLRLAFFLKAISVLCRLQRMTAAWKTKKAVVPWDRSAEISQMQAGLLAQERLARRPDRVRGPP